MKNTLLIPNSRFIASSAMALSIAAALPALAQGPAIEEILVTAEHRQSTLQETEISMSAFSADSLRDLGITNAGQIGQYTPNVQMSPLIGGKSGFAVAIRGVRQGETYIAFEPSVGLYLDGVLIAKNVGSVLDVADMERIEVLRGPQGTLYGRNTIGGTINVITRRPVDALEGRLEATLGSESQQDFRGMLNVPLLGEDSPIGPLSVRVSGASLQRDGLYDNDYAGAAEDEIEERDRQVALAHVRWQPAEALDVMYSYDYSENEETPFAVFATNLNPARPAAAGLAPYLAQRGERPSSISLNNPHSTDAEVEGHALHVDWELSDDLTVSSISAYRELDNTALGDSDGSPLSLLWTEDYQQDEMFTQELRLVGSAFDARLDYVIGAYYLDEDGDVDGSTWLDVSLVSRTPIPYQNRPFRNRFVADFQNESWALYTQGTYALTDRWNLTAGVRYTEEDREMNKTAMNSGVAPVQFPQAQEDFDNVSPMGSISYDWSDDIMTYAKVSAGYQSGGFNPRDPDPVGFTIGFDEETLISYEIGWKSTFCSQRYRFNGAVFYSDYDDKQINAFNPFPTPRTVYFNAGQVEISGLELEFVAQLTEEAQVGLDYGYVDPDYKDFEDPAGTDLSYLNFPFTPNNTGHAFFAWEFPRLDIGLVTARIDWSYKDDMRFLPTVPERNSEHSYQLWDARLTLSEIAGPGDTRMRASLWGKNLADEEYWNFGVNLYNGQGWDLNPYGEERTYGVDLALEF